MNRAMTATPRLTTPRTTRSTITILAIGAMATFIWVLTARMAAPSDLFGEDQPRTVGYTVDMLVNNHWLLQYERGEIPATKPPLYNWLAAPFVAVAGYSSEIAHKAPSVLALLLSCGLLLHVGRRIDPTHGLAIGLLAIIAALANQIIFKAGYLARPDMLLSALLLLGWCLATELLSREQLTMHDGAANESANTATADERRWLVLGFWLCVGLAALTKGPPALVLVIYSLIGSRWVLGSWRAAGAFGWWWGLPLGLAIFAIWVVGVAIIDRDHLLRQLWFHEFFGRITGLGSEGTREGPREFLYRLFHMPIYFVLRFLPWSIPAILAVVTLWTREDRSTDRRWRDLPRSSGVWLQGAAVMTVIVLGVLSFSAGKRPIYVAPALLPGSVLAAWWLLVAAPQNVRRATPLAAIIASVVTLSVLTVSHWRQDRAPSPDFGAEIERFVQAAETKIDGRLDLVMCWNAGGSHLQSMLGMAQPEIHDRLVVRLRAGERTLVLAGEHPEPSYDFIVWLDMHDIEAQVEMLAQSAELPRARGWPERVTLYDVQPNR